MWDSLYQLLLKRDWLRGPQRLKPVLFSGLCGTTEVVPLPVVLMRISRGAREVRLVLAGSVLCSLQDG